MWGSVYPYFDIKDMRDTERIFSTGNSYLYLYLDHIEVDELDGNHLSR
jgi:hypothetical protein